MHKSTVYKYVIYHSWKVLEKLKNAWKVLEFAFGKGCRNPVLCLLFLINSPTWFDFIIFFTIAYIHLSIMKINLDRSPYWIIFIAFRVFYFFCRWTKPPAKLNLQPIYLFLFTFFKLSFKKQTDRASYRAAVWS